MLNTLISVGRFGDPKIRADALEVPDREARRDSPSLSAGGEPRRRRPPVGHPGPNATFRNAAVEAGVTHAPAEYVVVWQRFDNATGMTTTLGETRALATSVDAPKDSPAAPSTYIRVEISADGGPESWTKPAHAYFRPDAAGWTLVGFERVPGGNPQGKQRAPRRRTNRGECDDKLRQQAHHASAPGLLSPEMELPGWGHQSFGRDNDRAARALAAAAVTVRNGRVEGHRIAAWTDGVFLSFRTSRMLSVPLST